MDPNVLPFIWLGIAVVFGVVEGLSPALVCIWFCVGAVAACVASLFFTSILAQLMVFVIASAVGLLALRPFFIKRSRLKEAARTDVDALMGRVVTVTQDIPSEGSGRALLADTTWLANSINHTSIAAGTQARIVDVQGTHLIVETLIENNDYSSQSRKEDA